MLENLQYWHKDVEMQGDPGGCKTAASTLLIPGYVDSEEVHRIASFIARYNPDTPYTRLAFHPQFFMDDLPFMTRKEAESCVQAAEDAGVNQVKLSNLINISYKQSLTSFMNRCMI